MKKSTQTTSAFAFGVVFVMVMLGIAIAIPYPTKFQLLVFRITLALAAGGICAMLPGFLSVTVPTYVRAGGSLAVFAIIFFFNPATLTIQGTPTNTPGLFTTSMEEDTRLVEYYWKQADLTFRFPKDGWTISTKAAEAGLGDMTIEHINGKDAQIQLHVSVLDEKYRNNWETFRINTINLWKGTISQFGEVDTKEDYVDGRSAFRISGTIRGQEQGLKSVDLEYVPLGDNRLFEIHLTRNAQHDKETELMQALDLIVSTVKFDR